MRVAAIGEAAFAEVGQKFREVSFHRGKIQMVQSEQLHAGAVDQVAARVEVIQLGVGGGVFAGVEHGGNFARGGLCGGDQRVNQC